jgi:hypothetical protein
MTNTHSHQPMPPLGYACLHDPIALHHPGKGPFIVYAHGRLSQGVGILIYTPHSEGSEKPGHLICFLSPEAAIRATDSLLHVAMDLLPHCSPMFLQDEQERKLINRVHNAFWAQEATQSRQLAAELPGEEKQSGAEG